MGRLAKAFVFLLVLGAVAFVGYSYYPPALKPKLHQVNQVVTLNVD